MFYSSYICDLPNFYFCVLISLCSGTKRKENNEKGFLVTFINYSKNLLK